MNAYFGESWGPMLPPEDDEEEREPVLCVATPVGQLCLDCAKPIVDGDQGLIIPWVHLHGPTTMEAHHRKCFLFSTTRFTLPRPPEKGSP
jgi:hypothetical protein